MTLALEATKPLDGAAKYLAGPAREAAGAIATAAEKSITQNSAVVFGVTALTCFLLGAFWRTIVR